VPGTAAVVAAVTTFVAETTALSPTVVAVFVLATADPQPARNTSRRIAKQRIIPVLYNDFFILPLLN
jgi:hypothetical protein